MGYRVRDFRLDEYGRLVAQGETYHVPTLARAKAYARLVARWGVSDSGVVEVYRDTDRGSFLLGTVKHDETRFNRC